jgi:hypothetical protein
MTSVGFRDRRRMTAIYKSARRSAPDLDADRRHRLLIPNRLSGSKFAPSASAAATTEW